MSWAADVYEHVTDRRVLCCDGPGCDEMAMNKELENNSWLMVEWLDAIEAASFDFCSWACVIRFGSRVEPDVVVEQ